jgi:putative tricarboxylic transport membrane protein
MRASEGILKGLAIVFSAVIICVGLMPGSTPAAYPERDITIVCPFGVGGPTDSYIRVVAIELEKIVGQKVKVLNIVGGQSVPAFKKVQGEPADGYTIMAISDSDIINSILGRYDIREMAPIAMVQKDQGLFWVPQNSRFAGLKEVLADAKANPGKQKWVGAIQFEEVVVALFMSRAGVKAQYTPYKDSNEAVAALAGGFFDVGYKEISGVYGLWEAKKIRPIVVLTEKRLEKYPDIPTARELSVDVTLGRWRGVGVKKGTSPEILSFLEGAFTKAVQSKIYQEFAEKTFTNLRPGFKLSEETKKAVDEDFILYGEIMKSIGMVK